ncbi:MAG TPA: CBS domain-containing protein [Firmicutes bacterium]|nr:CBS domain-containing protein [Bacillota bacterium]
MEFVAREIMTTPVISVGPETKLAEVVRVMAEKNISGVPVVDGENVVVGIISETDIVAYAGKTEAVRLIGSSAWISPYEERTGGVMYRKGFELLANTPVERVMAKKVITVKEDTPGLEVARIMNRKKINRVPVVDAAGKLVGLITRADLVRALAERGT